MLRVVLDTTVIREDLFLHKTSAARLLAAAEAGRAFVHISPVVLAEAERRYLEDVRADAQAVAAKLKSLGQFGMTVTHDLDDEQRRASQMYPSFLAEIILRPGVQRDDWPDVSHEALVDRDMRMLPPFRKGKGGTTGYRDTLIWLGTIDIARRYPDDDVVLVSANAQDFCDPRTARASDADAPVSGRSPAEQAPVYALSQALIGEVGRQLGDKAQVHLVRDLQALADRYLPAAEVELAEPPQPTNDLSARQLLDLDPDARAAILEALWEANDRIRALDLVPRFNPKEGDYDNPDVDLEAPRDIDEPALEDIEGPFDLVIENVSPVDNDRVFEVTCTHGLGLTFEGFIYKSDYYVRDDDDEDIDVLDSDWNDYMVRVSFRRVVRVESTVLFTRYPSYDATVSGDELQLTLVRAET